MRYIMQCTGSILIAAAFMIAPNLLWAIAAFVLGVICLGAAAVETERHYNRW